MGARKHIAAEKLKEARKNLYFAKLVGVPSSPRKMRYVVDMIRGMEVNRALGVLRFSKKQASADVEKLLRSAIANWEAKNDRKAEISKDRDLSIPVKIRRKIPEQVRDDLDLPAYGIYGLKQCFHSFFLLMIQFFCTARNFSGLICIFRRICASVPKERSAIPL